MASGAINITTVEDYEKTSIGQILCTAPIPFGGDDQWLFYPNTKKFDLSRGSVQKLVVECDEELRNHSGFMFDPRKAALVIVDMQNYFLHPIYRDHTAGLAAVSRILRVIEKCRQEDIQIIWLNWGISDKDLRTMPPAVSRGFSKSLGWHIGLGAELPDGQGRCLFKETWNAELYSPLKAAVNPQDLFFDKSQMSGMWSAAQPLPQYLQVSGIKTLLFAGVNTDQCVYGTLSDAYARGWDCVLLSDCTGTMTGRGAQELCDYNVATNMGFVTDSQAFCDAQLL